MKVKNPENSEAKFMTDLHLVYGDISDQEEELKIKRFEMPLFEACDSQKSVIFRTLYLKERYRPKGFKLITCYEGSFYYLGRLDQMKFEFYILNSVRKSLKILIILYLDGSEREMDEITLKDTTLRGMIFMRKDDHAN